MLSIYKSEIIIKKLRSSFLEKVTDLFSFSTDIFPTLIISTAMSPKQSASAVQDNQNPSAVQLWKFTPQYWLLPYICVSLWRKMTSETSQIALSMHSLWASILLYSYKSELVHATAERCMEKSFESKVDTELLIIQTKCGSFAALIQMQNYNKSISLVVWFYRISILRFFFEKEHL